MITDLQSSVEIFSATSEFCLQAMTLKDSSDVHLNTKTALIPY